MAAQLKKIGTHDGSFHCDEALACFLLQQTNAYRSSEIVRTRDSALLDTLDIVVDVGAVFDVSKNRFDHHQRGFTETFDQDKHNKIKLSSAGLVYKYFGREVITNLCPNLSSSSDVDRVYMKVYNSFIEPLDAIDNGISAYPDDIKPLYKSKTDLSSRVGRLNPDWNEESNAADLYSRFLKAVALTGAEFCEDVKFYANSWMPARNIVKQAIENRFNVHPSGQIVKLDTFTIWKNHLLDLEEEMKLASPILYVLYSEAGSSKWRIQCVPESESSFVSRKSLPEPWRGVRDDALSALTLIPGCVFIHSNGFIGGTNSYEGVLAMADKAVQWEEANKKQKTEA